MKRFKRNKFTLPEKGRGWQALLGRAAHLWVRAAARAPSHSSQARAQDRGYRGQPQERGCRKARVLRGSYTGGLGDAQLPEMWVNTCRRVPVGIF